MQFLECTDVVLFSQVVRSSRTTPRSDPRFVRCSVPPLAVHTPKFTFRESTVPGRLPFADDVAHCDGVAEEAAMPSAALSDSMPRGTTVAPPPSVRLRWTSHPGVSNSQSRPAPRAEHESVGHLPDPLQVYGCLYLYTTSDRTHRDRRHRRLPGRARPGTGERQRNHILRIVRPSQ